MMHRRGRSTGNTYPGVDTADAAHGFGEPRSDRPQRAQPGNHPRPPRGSPRCLGRPVTEHEPTARHVVGRFGRDATEVRRARTLVRSSLHSWGLADEAPAIELAVSELVTNALVHGRGDIEVRLGAGAGTVRLDVCDRGGDTGEPALRDAVAGQRGGWGLRLLDELADAWGAEASPSETRVWMVWQAATPEEV